MFTRPTRDGASAHANARAWARGHATPDGVGALTTALASASVAVAVPARKREGSRRLPAAMSGVGFIADTKLIETGSVRLWMVMAGDVQAVKKEFIDKNGTDAVEKYTAEASALLALMRNYAPDPIPDYFPRMIESSEGTRGTRRNDMAPPSITTPFYNAISLDVWYDRLSRNNSANETDILDMKTKMFYHIHDRLAMMDWRGAVHKDLHQGNILILNEMPAGVNPVVIIDVDQSDIYPRKIPMVVDTAAFDLLYFNFSPNLSGVCKDATGAGAADVVKWATATWQHSPETIFMTFKGAIEPDKPLEEKHFDFEAWRANGREIVRSKSNAWAMGQIGHFLLTGNMHHPVTDEHPVYGAYWSPPAKVTHMSDYEWATFANAWVNGSEASDKLLKVASEVVNSSNDKRAIEMLNLTKRYLTVDPNERPSIRETKTSRSVPVTSASRTKLRPGGIHCKRNNKRPNSPGTAGPDGEFEGPRPRPGLRSTTGVQAGLGGNPPSDPLTSGTAR